MWHKVNLYKWYSVNTSQPKSEQYKRCKKVANFKQNWSIWQNGAKSGRYLHNYVSMGWFPSGASGREHHWGNIAWTGSDEFPETNQGEPWFSTLLAGAISDTFAVSHWNWAHCERKATTGICQDHLSKRPLGKRLITQSIKIQTITATSTCQEGRNWDGHHTRDPMAGTTAKPGQTQRWTKDG